MKKGFLFFLVLFLFGALGTVSAQSFGKNGEAWFPVDDSGNGGSSRISLNVSGSTVTVSGKVTTQFQYGFIGFGYGCSPEERELLKAANGIRFKVKGDGKSYDFRLETSNVKDYNYYCKKFTATSDWTTVEIRFKSMAQKDWGQKVRLSPSSYYQISFQTIGQPIASVNLAIKDVELF